jgi:hypothetical protein
VNLDTQNPLIGQVTLQRMSRLFEIYRDPPAALDAAGVLFAGIPAIFLRT